MTTQGSCHCGKVTYRINDDIRNVVNCHCDFCRSHTGAAFASYAAIPYEALEVTWGTDSIHSYAGDHGSKHFCSHCGTPLYNLNDNYPGACMLYLGTLDDCRSLTPRRNVWCDSKLAWVDELGAIKSLPKGLPTRGGR